MACQALSASVVNDDTEQELSPLSGKPMKKHEKWGLKSLSKEQHTRFWEHAAYWCRVRFSEPQWKQVVCRIERAAKEDNVIMFGWHATQQPIDPATAIIDRRRLIRSSSSLTSPTNAHPLCPPRLRRISSSTPTTTRPRWDIVNSGPATPLSATSSIKNAFAEGGVWASLSPKTPVSASSISPTPITAIPAEPWTPEPPQDTEAKAAYDKVRKEIKQIALRACANRLGLRRSSSGGQDVIHPSMVKPKDEIVAAEMTLESLELELDLTQIPDPNLPVKIEQFADTEASYLLQYSIPAAEKLSDIDSWLLIDENTGEMTTILEAQRDLLRLNRSLRKDQDLSMRDTAVQCAWAVKILSDLEHIADSRADADSADSDEGYSYENFLRNIRSESTLSEASVGSAISSPSHTGAKVPGKQPRARHSSSPLKRAVSSLSLTASPSPARRPFPHRRTLSINTSSSNAVSPTELSPEERFYRHQGPSMADLDSWADELKNMERKRAGMILEGALHSPAASSTPSLSPGGSGSRRRKRTTGDSTPSQLCGTVGLLGGMEDVMLRRFLDDYDGDRGEEATTPRLDTMSGSFPRLEPPSRPPYLVPQDSEQVTGRLRNGYNLRAALRLESHRRSPYVMQQDSEDEVTTPRQGNHPRFPLRISPPRRLPCLVQRHSDLVPGQAALENREAGLRVNRSISLDHCVPRLREAEDVQEWVRELERMESREKVRQMGRFL
ncbi:aspartate kinase [Curvularia clavata]|uniref:Aspartate kinase n=1 Tax=Curvularia clavata TaxID=95742 RepID=A0A9Q8Z3S7_CURCL|nr:aspartate kinase [Curvularia clavata]